MTEKVVELFWKVQEGLISLEFICNQTYARMNADKKVDSGVRTGTREPFQKSGTKV